MERLYDASHYLETISKDTSWRPCGSYTGQSWPALACILRHVGTTREDMSRPEATGGPGYRGFRFTSPYPVAGRRERGPSNWKEVSFVPWEKLPLVSSHEFRPWGLIRHRRVNCSVFIVPLRRYEGDLAFCGEICGYFNGETVILSRNLDYLDLFLIDRERILIDF